MTSLLSALVTVLVFLERRLWEPPPHGSQRASCLEVERIRDQPGLCPSCPVVPRSQGTWPRSPSTSGSLWLFSGRADSYRHAPAREFCTLFSVLQFWRRGHFQNQNTVRCPLSQKSRCHLTSSCEQKIPESFLTSLLQRRQGHCQSWSDLRAGFVLNPPQSENCLVWLLNNSPPRMLCTSPQTM